MTEVHMRTVIDMLERDVENKYSQIRKRFFEYLTALSSSISLLKLAMPSIEQWICGKEKQYLPKVQDMVNMSAGASFADPDISVEDAYAKAKQLMNEGIDNLIKSCSELTLESVDQLCNVLLGVTLSL